MRSLTSWAMPRRPSAQCRARSPGVGGTAISLVPARGEYQPGRMTGIALVSSDARADHAELKAKGVDVDAELMGGDGTVPLLFFFRDRDANHLMIVEGH